MNALKEFAEQQIQALELQLQAARTLLENAEKLQREAARKESLKGWYISRLSEELRVSENSIYKRIQAGALVENVHYIREKTDSKRSRIIFNVEAVNQWLQGNKLPPISRPASRTTGAKSASGSSGKAKGATKA